MNRDTIAGGFVPAIIFGACLQKRHMPRSRERDVRDESDYSEGETPPWRRGRHRSRRGTERRKHRDWKRHRHRKLWKRDCEPSPTASYSYGYEDARSHRTRYRKRRAIKKEAAIMSQGQNVVDNERKEEVRPSKHEIEEDLVVHLKYRMPHLRLCTKFSLQLMLRNNIGLRPRSP